MVRTMADITQDMFNSLSRDRKMEFLFSIMEILRNNADQFFCIVIAIINFFILPRGWICQVSNMQCRFSYIEAGSAR